MCGGCHDITQKSINFDGLAVVPVGRKVYTITFWFMSKDEAASRMKNDS